MWYRYNTCSNVICLSIRYSKGSYVTGKDFFQVNLDLELNHFATDIKLSEKQKFYNYLRDNFDSFDNDWELVRIEAFMIAMNSNNYIKVHNSSTNLIVSEVGKIINDFVKRRDIAYDDHSENLKYEFLV